MWGKKFELPKLNQANEAWSNLDIVVIHRHLTIIMLKNCAQNRQISKLKSRFNVHKSLKSYNNLGYVGLK